MPDRSNRNATPTLAAELVQIYVFHLNSSSLLNLRLLHISRLPDIAARRTVPHLTFGTAVKGTYGLALKDVRLCSRRLKKLESHGQQRTRFIPCCRHKQVMLVVPQGDHNYDNTEFRQLWTPDPIRTMKSRNQ